MTGIEKIIGEIRAESEAAAAKQLDAARQEAQTIRTAAEAEAARAAQTERNTGKARAEAVVTAGNAAAVLAKRKALLETKQQLIAEVIDAAKQQLLALPDEKAVALLLKMLARYAADSVGELQLSAKDLARLPEDFAAQIAAAAPAAKLTVSSTPANIEGGFVLKSGDIEQNCSFESLFYAAREQLADKALGQLFCG